MKRVIFCEIVNQEFLSLMTRFWTLKLVFFSLLTAVWIKEEKEIILSRNEMKQITAFVHIAANIVRHC